MRQLQILLFIFCFCSVSAQNIKGTVKDADGQILPFASILIKGTQSGATANQQGQFRFHLSPGNYVLTCHYIGYASAEKLIHVDSSNQTINFVLTQQQLTLKEVVVKKNSEDPAYEIIRHAIRKRKFYQNQVRAFQAQIYIKGMLRLINLPRTILGKKIPEEDRNEMGIDSSGSGIIYLTESVTKVSAEEPGKLKMEVVSTRVSGNNGLGFSFPAFLSFYDNYINIADQLNPRGFVSPIADNALNFYDYKFMGSFFEDGNEVNVIKVIPKRNYEPLFSGVINITEDDWRIFSCDLKLTKKSQLEILDTLRITQLFTPVEKNIWRIKNQVLHFSFNQFGLKATGNFVNVYSDYNLNPHFSKDFFDRVVLKYDTAVNKKPHAYWDSIRPVPLEPEEIKDYQTKDSALALRLDSTKQNLDSLRNKQGPVKLVQIFWSGVKRTSSTNQYQVQFEPLLQTLQFNTVEGVAINPSLVISKFSKKLNSQISFIADVRYGFNNGHLNPWAGLKFNSKDVFDPDKKMKHESFFLAGGKRVSEFFKESQISGLANSVGTLLYGTNIMKIYENYFFKTGFTKKWESGFNFLIEAEYEDRLPLENTTDFILNKKWQYRFTPNYPVEVLTSQFQKHQAVVTRATLSFQPGQQYIQFPTYKMAIGSELPTFTLDYRKGIPDIFGSDVNYDRWSLNVADESKLNLAGRIKYSITLGGFLNRRSVFVQDYKHFYSSYSHIAGEYVRSLQLATTYEFSNQSPFYTELLFEHHSDGFITNQIPGLKRWNWNLVEGANALYIQPGTRYSEVFIGLENIFKIFRVDAVVGFQNGFKPVFTYRIGFGGLLGDALNAERFKRIEKIIDTW